jgi:hypothetical protein
MGPKPSMPNLPVMFYFVMDENLFGNQMNSFLWTIWQVFLILKRNIFTRWVFWTKIQVQKWEANILLKKKSQKIK